MTLHLKNYAESAANYTKTTPITIIFPVINPSVKTSSNGCVKAFPSEAAHFIKNTES